MALLFDDGERTFTVAFSDTEKAPDFVTKYFALYPAGEDVEKTAAAVRAAFQSYQAEAEKVLKDGIAAAEIHTRHLKDSDVADVRKYIETGVASARMPPPNEDLQNIRKAVAKYPSLSDPANFKVIAATIHNKIGATTPADKAAASKAQEVYNGIVTLLTTLRKEGIDEAVLQPYEERLKSLGIKYGADGKALSTTAWNSIESALSTLKADLVKNQNHIVKLGSSIVPEAIKVLQPVDGETNEAKRARGLKVLNLLAGALPGIIPSQQVSALSSEAYRVLAESGMPDGQLKQVRSKFAEATAPSRNNTGATSFVADYENTIAPIAQLIESNKARIPADQLATISDALAGKSLTEARALLEYFLKDPSTIATKAGALANANQAKERLAELRRSGKATGAELAAEQNAVESTERNLYGVSTQDIARARAIVDSGAASIRDLEATAKTYKTQITSGNKNERMKAEHALSKINGAIDYHKKRMAESQLILNKAQNNLAAIDPAGSLAISQSLPDTNKPKEPTTNAAQAKTMQPSSDQARAVQFYKTNPQALETLRSLAAGVPKEQVDVWMNKIANGEMTSSQYVAEYKAAQAQAKAKQNQQTPAQALQTKIEDARLAEETFRSAMRLTEDAKKKAILNKEPFDERARYAAYKQAAGDSALAYEDYLEKNYPGFAAFAKYAAENQLAKSETDALNLYKQNYQGKLPDMNAPVSREEIAKKLGVEAPVDSVKALAEDQTKKQMISTQAKNQEIAKNASLENSGSVPMVDPTPDIPEVAVETVPQVASAPKEDPSATKQQAVAEQKKVVQEAFDKMQLAKDAYKARLDIAQKQAANPGDRYMSEADKAAFAESMQKEIAFERAKVDQATQEYNNAVNALRGIDTAIAANTQQANQRKAEQTVKLRQVQQQIAGLKAAYDAAQTKRDSTKDITAVEAAQRSMDQLRGQLAAKQTEFEALQQAAN